MKIRMYKRTGVENRKPSVSLVKGRKIPIPEETRRLFYVYRELVKGDYVWYFNEGATGLSIAESTISEKDVIKKARSIIKAAKKEGRFHRKLLAYSETMKNEGILIPLNKKKAQESLVLC